MMLQGEMSHIAIARGDPGKHALEIDQNLRHGLSFHTDVLKNESLAVSVTYGFVHPGVSSGAHLSIVSRCASAALRQCPTLLWFNADPRKISCRSYHLESYTRMYFAGIMHRTVTLCIHVAQVRGSGRCMQFDCTVRMLTHFSLQGQNAEFLIATIEVWGFGENAGAGASRLDSGQGNAKDIDASMWL